MGKDYFQIYEKYGLKLILIPIFLFLIALGGITYDLVTEGSIVKRGVSLAGGTSITVETDQSDFQFIEAYESTFAEPLQVRELSKQGSNIGYTFESTLQDSQAFADLATQYFPNARISTQVTGSSLGERFFAQMIQAIIIALIFMGVVVYIAFRSIKPSLLIIAAITADIIITVGIFDLTGQYLSTAGVAAFLMIIGYSVDTNILLNTKMLKQHDNHPLDRIKEAAKTGFFMTATTLISLSIALFFTNSEIIGQIMLILVIGLVVDVINTWVFNAVILLRMVKK